jgi:hypothetical protein
MNLSDSGRRSTCCPLSPRLNTHWRMTLAFLHRLHRYRATLPLACTRRRGGAMFISRAIGGLLGGPN